MSEKFWLDRKIGFQNTFYTKCNNVIIDSIGPSIIWRSILPWSGGSSIKNVGKDSNILSGKGSKLLGFIKRTQILHCFSTMGLYNPV